MLYAEYIEKAKEISLVVDEETGLTYIRPDYLYLLHLANLKLSDVTDFDEADAKTVYDNLLLERDLRNGIVDKKPFVLNWIYDIITTQIEPVILQEQNEMLKDIIEYRKQKNAIDDRTKELDKKEQELDDKGKVIQFNRSGFDFSKKRP